MIYCRKKFSFFLSYLFVVVPNVYFTTQVEKLSATNIKRNKDRQNPFFKVVRVALPSGIAMNKILNESNKKNETIEIAMEKPQEKSFSCSLSSLQKSTNKYQFNSSIEFERASKLVFSDSDITSVENTKNISDFQSAFRNLIDKFRDTSNAEILKSESMNSVVKNNITRSQEKPIDERLEDQINFHLPYDNRYIKQEIVQIPTGAIQIKDGIILKTLNLMKSYVQPTTVPIMKIINFLQIQINLSLISYDKNQKNTTPLLYDYQNKRNELINRSRIAAFENLITLLKDDQDLNDESRQAMDSIIRSLCKNFWIIIERINNHKAKELQDLFFALEESNQEIFLDYLNNFYTSLDSLKEMITQNTVCKLSVNKYDEKHETEITSLSFKIANLIHYFSVNKSNYSKPNLEGIARDLFIFEKFSFLSHNGLQKNNGEFEIKFNENLWKKYKDFIDNLYSKHFKDHKNQNDIQLYFFENLFFEKNKNSELISANLISCFDVIKKNKHQSEIKFNLPLLENLTMEFRKCLQIIIKK